MEINQYANREGISVNQVRQCCQIGILQLRKNKDKTYVVDTPVCSYDNTNKIDAEVAELIGLKKASTQKNPANQPCQSAKFNETHHLQAHVGKKNNIGHGDIKQLVEKMLKKAENIKNTHPKPAENHPFEDKNKKTAPQSHQNKPYLQQVIRAMHAQLDDIEKHQNL